MCPSFCPTKTTKHFSPLAVLVQHKNMHRCCGITQACWRQHCLSSAFFSQRILSIFANYFFPFLLFAFLSCTSTKKAQTTTFLIKFLRCFFSLSPIFLTFLGFGDYFTFWLFFFRVWGRQTVESGEDLIGSFLPCDMELESCWCIKSHFSLVMWHHTADPIGGFLWVSFVAFTS